MDQQKVKYFFIAMAFLGFFTMKYQSANFQESSDLQKKNGVRSYFQMQFTEQLRIMKTIF